MTTTICGFFQGEWEGGKSGTCMVPYVDGPCTAQDRSDYTELYLPAADGTKRNMELAREKGVLYPFTRTDGVVEERVRLPGVSVLVPGGDRGGPLDQQARDSGCPWVSGACMQIRARR
jgi:hypothetical protein